MNLVLLEPSDFETPTVVRISGRRLEHIRRIHRAAAGDVLRIGILNGSIGLGRIAEFDDTNLTFVIEGLDETPPAALPLRLILALPRPKVLNRTLAAAASLGIKEIDLINTWRVEKSYWNSPRLSEQNIRLQLLLGLEQAADTVLPVVRQHRLFMPFVREILPAGLDDRLLLVAHPGATTECPRTVEQSVVLAIGPEGGFIDPELESLRNCGFQAVSLGRRILRVETALAHLLGRLF